MTEDSPITRRVTALRLNAAARRGPEAANDFILSVGVTGIDDETGALMETLHPNWVEAFDAYLALFGEEPDVLLRVGNDIAVPATRELIGAYA